MDKALLFHGEDGAKTKVLHMAFFSQHIDGRRALVGLALTLSLGSPASNAVAQSPQNQQASVSTDGALHYDVAAALAASPVLNGQEIYAAVASGQVTLSGYVDDEASKDLAQIVVSKVNGVRSVINNLTIVPIGAPSSNEPATADGQVPDGQQQMPPNVADQQAPPAAYPPSEGSQYPGPQPPQDQYPAQSTRQMPSGPVQLPLGTLLNVRLIGPLDNQQTAPGTLFSKRPRRMISTSTGIIAVPQGAVLTGHVVDATSTKGSLVALPLRLAHLDYVGRPNLSIEHRCVGWKWSGQGRILRREYHCRRHPRSGHRWNCRRRCRSGHRCDDRRSNWSRRLVREFHAARDLAA